MPELKESGQRQRQGQAAEPVAPQAIIENLPRTLQEEGYFCNWKYIVQRGCWRKLPLDPRTGQHAASDDLRSFATLREAVARQREGVGLAFKVYGRICGIDLDNCIRDGRIKREAYDICRIMHSYTEYSPSGTGLRVLFLVPKGYEYDRTVFYIRNPYGERETYIPGMTNRFLTLTGRPLFRGLDLAERQAEFEKVLDLYMRRPAKEDGKASQALQATPLEMSDIELLDRIKTSRDYKFAELWAGNWQDSYPSQSEADQALLDKLAFWTGGDTDRMERLFTQSGLSRDKWRTRESYRRDTIAKAIDRNDQFYDPNFKKR